MEDLKKWLLGRIDSVGNTYDELVKPYKTDYGINISLMNNMEKQEFINKRNCLIVQQETYKEVLKEIENYGN